MGIIIIIIIINYIFKSLKLGGEEYPTYNKKKES